MKKFFYLLCLKLPIKFIFIGSKFFSAVITKVLKEWQKIKKGNAIIHYNPYQTFYQFPIKKKIIDRPVRICILAEFGESWDSLDSVWRAFNNDKRCHVVVVALQNEEYAKTVTCKLEDALIHSEVPFVKPAFYDFDIDQPDVVIFHNPYEGLREFRFSFNEISKKVARTIYIPYGFEIGGGALRKQTQFNNPIQQYAWKVFVRSKLFKSMYGKNCESGNNHVVEVGHPMVDAILNIDKTKFDSKLVNSCKDKTVFLWNPHYGETTDQSDFSTFLRWKEFFLTFFEKGNDIFLILRPHPLLFSTLISRNLMKSEELDLLLNRIKNNPNIFLDIGANYHAAFSLSNAMLSDISSFLTLYPVTGKPVLYLHNTTGPGYHEAGEIIDYFYWGETEKEIIEFIEMVIEKKDPGLKARMEKLRKQLIMPENGAGFQIKEEVLSAISLGL